MRVAVLAERPELYARALRQTLAAGQVLVPLHARYSAAELEACLADARPQRILRTEADLEPGDPGPAWLDGPDRPALHLYTSGTTGAARGVTLWLDGLKACARAGGDLLELGPRDTWLVPLPLYHIGGLMVLFRCALSGATPRFGPLARELPHATVLSVVPTQLARLIASGAAAPPGLRAVLVGGGPLSESLQTEALRAGWPVLASYGMTETAAMCCCVRPGDRTTGHCGQPLPGWSVAVRAGEILVQGPTTDGWLRTGDLGRIDATGNLRIDGRRADRIVTGGENVRADEVEAALLRHPAVAEACVVGLDCPEWGQRVAAALVLDRPASDEEILAEAGRTLARHELPRKLRRVERLPRTPLGKLQRARVRALLV